MINFPPHETCCSSFFIRLAWAGLLCRRTVQIFFKREINFHWSRSWWVRGAEVHAMLPWKSKFIMIFFPSLITAAQNQQEEIIHRKTLTCAIHFTSDRIQTTREDGLREKMTTHSKMWKIRWTWANFYYTFFSSGLCGFFFLFFGSSTHIQHTRIHWIMWMKFSTKLNSTLSSIYDVSQYAQWPRLGSMFQSAAVGWTHELLNGFLSFSFCFLNVISPPISWLFFFRFFFFICLFSSPIYLLCAPANFKRNSAAENDWAIVSGRTQCGTNNSSFVSILCFYFRCLFLLYGFIAQTKERSDNEIFSQVFLCGTRLAEKYDSTGWDLRWNWTKMVQFNQTQSRIPFISRATKWESMASLYIFLVSKFESDSLKILLFTRKNTRVLSFVRERREKNSYFVSRVSSFWRALESCTLIFQSCCEEDQHRHGTNAMRTFSRPCQLADVASFSCTNNCGWMAEWDGIE